MPKKRLEFGTWVCKSCNQVFETRRKLQEHKSTDHKFNKANPQYSSGGNCKYCNRHIAKIFSLHLHEKYCKLNPNSIQAPRYKFTDEQKERQRIIVLEGYAKGTYHGWMNCHSSKKSYPEEFFTKIIENEFVDKNYEYNYLFFQYRLDFAWPSKKLCIEIDGSQHKRIQYQIESDKKKDAKLLSEGWKVLRIDWSDLYNNTKYWIDKAKNFIDN